MSNEITFQLVGTEALVKKLLDMAEQLPKKVEAALYQECLIEMQESMRRTPVDTGALKGSHRTEKPKWSGREVSCAILVGGPAAPYALYVHENEEVDHPNGQDHFLSSTLLESLPYLAARIAKRLQV